MPGTDSSVLAYSKALNRCSDGLEISALFHRFIQTYRFDYFAINGLPGPSDAILDLTILHNFPADWAAEYVRGDYAKDDPIVAACRLRTEPFYWSEVADDYAGNPAAGHVMERARGFGLVEGLCLPIRGQNGYEAGVSLSGTAPSIDRATIPTLHLAGLYTYNHARALLRGEKAGRALTDREKEVLMWCALGKTAAEIGLHLGISETTVNSHIRRCMVKLEASNKVEAVTTAIREGLIVG